MRNVYIPRAEFTEQPRLLRCLELIRKLQKESLCINEIAAAADCSPRTAYRFLKTFHEAGFKVLKFRDKFTIKA